MKTRIFIAAALLFAIAILPGCQKDWASSWAGTYTGNAGSTFNRVVITSINNNTVKMDLQVSYGNTYVTYATVGNATLSDQNDAVVNEDGNISGYADPYHFAGTAVLNGNTITITGSATNKNNSGDIKYYAFTGTK